jgi:hypothetical protein
MCLDLEGVLKANDNVGHAYYYRTIFYITRTRARTEMWSRMEAAGTNYFK